MRHRTALSVRAAGSRTRVSAFLTDARHVARAFVVANALGSTVGRRAGELW